MEPGCPYFSPWIEDDFTSCFRLEVINGILPAAILICSLLLLTKTWVSYKKTHPHGKNTYYAPLDNADSTGGVSGATKPCRWTIFTLSRIIFSFAQFILFLYAGHQLYTNKPEYFADQSDSLGYTSRLILWGYLLFLSIMNFKLSSTRNLYANMICIHLNTIYVADFIISLINTRTYYIIALTSDVGLEYSISVSNSLLGLMLLSILIHEARDTPSEPILTDNGRTLSGENWASFYSRLMFSWLNPVLEKGFKQTLNDEDLMELKPENLSKNTLHNFRKSKSSNMLFSLIRVFFWRLFFQAVLCTIWSFLLFGPPYFLNKVVKSIENPGENTLTTSLIYVISMFLVSCAQSLIAQQAQYIGRTLGVRIQAIIIGEVFSKSLRCRDEKEPEATEEGENKEESKGNVNNLLSIDANKIGEVTAYFYFVYSFPLQIGISVWGLYRLLGTAALWGIFVMIACQPASYWVSTKFRDLHGDVMKATDKRIKLTDEMLSSIRIIKFFAWESRFKKKLTDIRDEELKALKSRLMMFLWINNLWYFIPVLIMLTTFTSYTYFQGHELTASVAFTSLALFNTFRVALQEFPMLMSLVLQSYVSLKRIEKYINQDEIDTDIGGYSSDQSSAIGFVNDASFCWEKPSTSTDTTTDKVILKNLNLSFPPKKLSIICGPTGSGKTTLIASLLGETYCTKGSAILPRIIPDQTSPLGGAVSGIAYVAQTAWLQNCSIRENILFGLPFDKERYEAVLYMTALTRDLDIFEFGDATEIGEKGIALSGGQKQRVSIARAVYSQANILILDDCLSAVDAHTAKHLYDYCLMGPLMKDRTVILVTHYVRLCMDGASYIVALKDGQVHGAGSPKSVLKSGALGEELSRTKDKEDENEGSDGPIPTVPKVVADRPDQKEGDGKLVDDETRAEGGITWSVYKTYVEATGGNLFWGTVFGLFALAQTGGLYQEYWIKIWSAAYNDPTKTVDAAYYLAVYFLIGLIVMGFISARSYALFTGSIRASKTLHDRMLGSILRSTVRFFDTTPMGRIVNRFSSDLSTIDGAATLTSFFLYSVVAAISVIVLICFITPVFLLPGTVIAYLFYAIGTYYLYTSRDLKRLNSVSRSPIYVQASEATNGVVTIRAFGSQERFLKENYDKIDDNNRPFLWLWATTCWLNARSEIIGASVGFCAGIVLVLARHRVDAGMAGLSLLQCLSFTHNVLWVVRNYSVTEMNMNSVERVSEYLHIEEEPPAHVPETEPDTYWPETGNIEVNNLVVKYSPEQPAVLRNVSFKVQPKEKIGIVGRTGSGKTTLALSIFRFMEPTSGSIHIDGVDIHTLGLHDLRSRLTIIPQDPVLFSGTLRTNLDPFDEYTDAELWLALKRSHLIDDSQEALFDDNRITLESPVTENGANWSQGQRQLIALARALVKRTRLIILDEATSSIDFETDRKIQDTIRTEFEQSTILCVAHRLLTIADYDRVLVLDQGEVVEFDTPYRLMTRDGSVFQHMCKRSGEFDNLLRLAQGKHTQL